MEITRDLVGRAIAGCGLGGEAEADRVWDWLMSDGSSERPESYRNRNTPEHAAMTGDGLARHLFFVHGQAEDDISQPAAALAGLHSALHRRERGGAR
jgi:hypothetical protein